MIDWAHVGSLCYLYDLIYRVDVYNVSVFTCVCVVIFAEALVPSISNYLSPCEGVSCPVYIDTNRDMIECIYIYTLLKEHRATVAVVDHLIFFFNRGSHYVMSPCHNASMSCCEDKIHFNGATGHCDIILQ